METLILLAAAAAAVAAFVAREGAHRREVGRLRLRLANVMARSTRSEELATVGAVVSDLAQELKSPLQGVLGNTELMLLAADRGEQAAEELREIRDNATRAAGIVRNLLAFAETTNLKRSWHDVNEIVSRAADICRTELDADCVAIEFVPHRRLPLVYVDGRQLEKVLITCIGRAGRTLRHSPGYARAKVTVTTDRRTQPDDRLLIEVEDDGGPVPVWDESFGDGGLTASTRIVEAHGGTVSVEDRPRGLLVHLEFPVTADAAAADARLPAPSGPPPPTAVVAVRGVASVP